MKSLIALVFVLAFIGLGQPALMNVHRLRGGGGSAATKEFFGVPYTSTKLRVPRATDMMERKIQILEQFFPKAKWYQNGLWFVNMVLKNMMKNGRRDDNKFYKKTTSAPSLLKDKIRF